MKDFPLTIDASLYVRIEKLASQMKISVADWLSLFFDNSGCPNLHFTPSGCPNPTPHNNQELVTKN